jgi:hypothetical protein
LYTYLFYTSYQFPCNKKQEFYTMLLWWVSAYFRPLCDCCNFYCFKFSHCSTYFCIKYKNMTHSKVQSVRLIYFYQYKITRFTRIWSFLFFAHTFFFISFFSFRFAVYNKKKKKKMFELNFITTYYIKLYNYTTMDQYFN